ncbi:MAG: alkaline phosphatase family protein [Eubacterium sp.]
MKKKIILSVFAVILCLALLITSTVWGWSTMLTGQWAYQNGINLPDTASEEEKEEHMDSISLDSPTFLRKYGAQGYRTVFTSSWDYHFTNTFKNEIDFLEQNKDIQTEYKYFESPTDTPMHKYLLECVTEGSPNEKDIIFGIYDSTDHNGHESGFTNSNPRYVSSFKTTDNYCYEIIEAIKSRPSYENEDWLILMTTDHGGRRQWHGEQNFECRTTWIVSNKPLDSKYYSQNYNGYVCN